MTAVASRACVAISVAAFAVSGCLSPVPLDPSPQIKVDKSLLGLWDCDDPLAEPGTGKSQLEITALDEFRFLVEAREPKEQPELYEAHASSIQAMTLFNVRAAKDAPPLEPHEWTFVRATLSGDALRLEMPSDDTPIKAASPAALRSLLEADLKKPGYFLDLVVCERAKVTKDKKDGPE
jgi:hypothetical protein